MEIRSLEFGRKVKHRGGYTREEAWQKLVKILLGNYNRVFKEPE